MCVRGAHSTLFAKNSDRHPDEVQLAKWFAARPAVETLRTQYLEIPDAPAAAFLGSQPTWLWGCEHGVNEHGVAIGNEKIFTTGRPHAQPPALLGMDIVRLVLERARDADDAFAICTSLVETYGQGGSGEPHADVPYFSSFLLTDARRGWIVETDNTSWVARPAGHAAAISNRVSIGTDWTRASADIETGHDFDTHRHPAAPLAPVDPRLATSKACVTAATPPTARDLAVLLRDHGGRATLPRETSGDDDGFTVCMHRPEMHAQTTASMIAELFDDGRPPRAWTCLGNPCVGVFVPGFGPGTLPELGERATWERFARLRSMVEAQPERAREIRAVLDPVEAEQWAAADAGAPATFAPIDDALRRLGV